MFDTGAANLSLGHSHVRSRLVEKIMIASNPNYLSSRLAHLTYASSVIDPSDSNSWDGILVEHHRIPEGERAETVTDQHVLWLWTRSISSQYAGPRGRFVRCSKGRGALTVTPVGPVPTLHSYTRSEVILCLGFTFHWKPFVRVGSTAQR